MVKGGLRMSKKIFAVALNTQGIDNPRVVSVFADTHAEALGKVLMNESTLRDIKGYKVIEANGNDNEVRELIISTYKHDYTTGYGNKIQTIKAVRNLTGWGLKESKDMVEETIIKEGLDVPF
jgi:hypothetical protein